MKLEDLLTVSFPSVCMILSALFLLYGILLVIPGKTSELHLLIWKFTFDNKNDKCIRLIGYISLFLAVVFLIYSMGMFSGKVTIPFPNLASLYDSNRAYKECEVSFRDKQYEDAIQCYKSVLKIKPDHQNALYRKSVSLLEQSPDGQNDNEILQDLTKALRIDPDFTDAEFVRGYIFARRGCYTMALEKFQFVLDRQPDDINALYNQASARLGSGKYTSAIAAYKNILANRETLDQDSISAQNKQDKFYKRVERNISEIEFFQSKYSNHIPESQEKNCKGTVDDIAQNPIVAQDYSEDLETTIKQSGVARPRLRTLIPPDPSSQSNKDGLIIVDSPYSKDEKYVRAKEEPATLKAPTPPKPDFKKYPSKPKLHGS